MITEAPSKIGFKKFEVSAKKNENREYPLRAEHTPLILRIVVRLAGIVDISERELLP